MLFLPGRLCKAKKKMKYNQSAGLVQMVFAFLSRPSVESKEKKNEKRSVSWTCANGTKCTRDISGEAFFL
jgi:hypothetical protein